MGLYLSNHGGGTAYEVAIETNFNKFEKGVSEAINSGRKVHFTTLGWLEIQKKSKWLPSYLYNEIELGKDRID